MSFLLENCYLISLMLINFQIKFKYIYLENLSDFAMFLHKELKANIDISKFTYIELIEIQALQYKRN